jgi:hypothetical protein
MDWLRWWHGSSTDPKFRMIAAECNMPLASIIGLWAYILECASSNKTRGQIDNFDLEVAGFHLGIDVVTPCNAMKRRNMFHETGETLHVTNWEKWQPKRERDDVSTDRVRKHRGKQKQELTSVENDVTPCNANETHVTPRGEESREDIKHSLFDEFWASYPRKVGKGAAEKAWQRAKINGHHAKVMGALESQKRGQDWIKEGGRFIPNPATWINQRRWEDGDTTPQEVKRDWI